MSITTIDDALLESEGRFHSSLPDVPGKSAEDMKEFMDYVPRHVVIPKLNEVISQVNNREQVYTIEETDALLEFKADVSVVDSLVADRISTLVEGKAGGASFRVDDCSGTYGYAWVSLYSKNVIPFPYSTEQGVVRGITYTVNDDGSLTLNGTAEGSATFNLYFDVDERLPEGIVPNERYVISCKADKEVSGCSFTAAYYKEEPDGHNYLGWLSVMVGGEKSAVFPSDGYAVRIYVNVAKGSVVDNVTIYPMLERGYKATEFTPYISDISQTTIYVASESEYLETYNVIENKNFVEIYCPEPYMDISTDNEAVYAECEYYRDFNKAFNVLYEKVMMGG